MSPVKIYIGGAWHDLSGTGAPNAPTLDSATVIDDTEIDLAWSAPGSGPTPDGYHVYDGATLVHTGAGLTFNHTGLGAGTTHTYTVRAYITGIGDGAASNSLVRTTDAAGGEPNVPTIGTAYALSSTSIRVPFTDNASDETGFKIYRNLNSGGYSLLATVATPNLTGYTDTTLSPEDEAKYKVSAYNGSGESAQSAASNSVTTPAESPSDPTGFAQTDATEDSITLGWSYSGPTPDGFYLYRDGSLIATKASGDRTHTDTGRAAGTSYDYALIAYIGGSNSNTVTTTGTTDEDVLDPPSLDSLSDDSVCNNPLTDNYTPRIGIHITSGDVTAQTKVFVNSVLVHTMAAGVEDETIVLATLGSKDVDVQHVKTGHTPSTLDSLNIVLVDPCL